MKFVRRASLVLSLTLIVAIAVGYVARRSELSSARDLRLSTAAELGAVRFNSLVESVEVAAAAGTDVEATASALAAIDPGLGVCAASATESSCTGDGPIPPDDLVTHTSDDAGEPADVAVYDSLTTIRAAGSELSVVVRGPADWIGARSDATVLVTTVLPPGVSVGDFVVDRGRRQTATTVESSPLVFVVAEGQNAIELPIEEQRFYLIIFSLAVILLFLAGVTLFVEQRSLHERASFDSLTRLPNRGEFERRAEEALLAGERQKSGACLLLFDLNGFKSINDTWGHYAGDEMLRTVGTRLRKAIRDSDLVARWGGDEFVVMMPGIGTDEMGTRRARELAEAIGGRTRLDGVAEPVRVTVSVGVSIWPQHGSTVEALVEAADQAMYHAKREGLTCRLADEIEVPNTAAELTPPRPTLRA